MRMRSLCYSVAIALLAGVLSSCNEYYESRIDRLYTECDARDLPPETVNSCLDRVARVQRAHPSPRLVALQRQLERQSEEANTDQGKGSEETVGANTDSRGGDEENGPDGYGEGDQGENSDSAIPPDPNGFEPGIGGDYPGDDERWGPWPDSMPPSEPQEPMNPDEE